MKVFDGAQSSEHCARCHIDDVSYERSKTCRLQMSLWMAHWVDGPLI